MAEDELGPLGTAVLGAIVLGVGLLIILPTALAERRIDPRDSCRPGESGKCFSRETGIVESADRETVRVRYDDGRKLAKLSLVTETYPGPRTRVLLERWNGDIVSIYDQTTERRYRTIRWPDVDTSSGWVFVFVGGLLLACSLVLGLWTSVQAARSKGKP